MHSVYASIIVLKWTILLVTDITLTPYPNSPVAHSNHTFLSSFQSIDPHPPFKDITMGPIMYLLHGPIMSWMEPVGITGKTSVEINTHNTSQTRFLFYSSVINCQEQMPNLCSHWDFVLSRSQLWIWDSCLFYLSSQTLSCYIFSSK